jgi:serine/threonine protein kinase
LKKPTQFGKYYLLDRINVGGMAEVFRAKAYGVEGFERLLAVKRILPNIAEDKEFISMFIDEAKIAVQLQHANICQIFDLGKVDDAYFIALEFVAGKDLRALYDRCKQRPEGGNVTMPVAQACFIIMKVCEGLDYAHNKKDQSNHELHLVHRDVSPQNVIISYEGEVKLIDFGIAKSVGKASKTQAGILKGKFGYMSPEQVRGLPLDRRSDVFSVGIVLYELLTGERLFVGETDFSTLEKVRNVEILPPSTYNRKIPDELERIVLKALAKDVDDRYQNAIDLHDDLQAFMYTAGEFYSRKDLSAWMKKTWVKEMTEESQRLEQYPTMPPPSASVNLTTTSPQLPSARQSGPRPSVPPPPPASMEVVTSAPPPPPPMTARAGNNGRASGKVAALAAPAAAAAVVESDLSWDEEELETHVYDSPKDASDAVVSEMDEISGLHEIDSEAELGDGKNGALDHIELSSDGAPVPSKKTPAAVPQVQIAPVPVAPMNGATKHEFELPPPPAPAPITGGGLFGDAGPTDIRPGLTAVGRPPSRPQKNNRVLVWVAAASGLLAVAVVTIVLFSLNRTGMVQITTDPSDGVRILVDNKPVHLDEAGRLKLEPGSYPLQVEREGYVQWRDRIDIKSGETLKRRVELEPLARSGFTLLSEPVGASASLDGKDLGGRTPFKVEGLLPGKHLLEVSAGGRTWSEQVVLEPGKMIEIRATLTPPQVAATPPPKSNPIDKEDGPVVKELAVKEPAPPRNVRPPKPPRVLDDPGRTPVAQRDPPVKKTKLPAAPVDEPKPDPPPSKPVVKESAGGGEGYLRIGSKPWTKISVDGKDTNLTTPQQRMVLSAGKHKITLTNPGFQINKTFTVEIKAGESETVIKDLRPEAAGDGD